MATTNWQMIRFSAGIAGYRIIRLGIELFLVPWTKILGYSVGLAGNVYLVYSIASILTGVFFLYQPTACFGTYRRAWMFFLVTVSLGCLGFAALLNVTSLWAIYVFAIVSGASTAGWNLTFQTATAVSFDEDKLGTISQLRQIFESIGFLLPSIALAVLANVDLSRTTGVDDTNEVAIRATAVFLAVAALLFYALSADQVIRAVAKMPANAATSTKQLMGGTNATRRIRESLKEFFTTSIVAYFWLTSILLSTSNITMALMSIITTEYLGMSNANALWIGALGFPIGGMSSVFFQIHFQRKINKKTLAVQGTTEMILFLVLLIGLSPLFPPSKESESRIMLFFIGFGGGFFFSGTFASSLTLWLSKLKNYSLSFNSQAAVINNLGVQGFIAITFQLQTCIVQFTIGNGASTSFHASLVCFLPIIFILLVALAITYRFIPYPKDDKFGWPDKTFFNVHHRLTMSVLDRLGLFRKGNLAFAKFQTDRFAFFLPHLKNSSVNRGPSLESAVALKPSDFQKFLEDFDKLGTDEEWWFLEAKLDSLLMDNRVALETRLKLLSRAQETIRLTTWCFEESNAGNRIADVLIQKAMAGIDVKVIVDEITLYYQDQESKLGIEGLPVKMAVLKRLVHGGVRVRMLNKWHNNKWPAYVIGTHRKFMLIDGKWLLTGGRNITDHYLSTEGFHFLDSEVLLTGNFDESTASFFDTKLWDCAADVAPLFPKRNMLARLNSVDAIFRFGFQEDSGTNQTRNYPRTCAMEEGILNNDGENDKEPEFVRGHIFRSASILFQDNCNVSVFQLDHKSGDPKGHDIVFSSLLFIIETAKDRIDLLFGYFQLFDELDAALTRAASRGVKLRLVTNSSETNGMSYLNGLFGPALERLLELGAEIYTPGKADQGDREFCLHYKVAIADDRAALVGSWNCLGTSVFYDSDYSVMIFDENGNAFRRFGQEVEDSIKAGRLNRVTEVSGFDVPLFYRLLGPRNIMQRGF